MQVLELLEKGAPANPTPVYLFVPGKSNPRARENTFEPFLAERGAELLIDAYVDEAHRDFGFGSLHADETKAERIVGEAKTVAFVAERRLIFVLNAEKYAENAAAALVAYVESPADFTILVMIAGKADKRTKFYKACEKAGTIVECPMLDARSMETWVRTEAKARGKKMDGEAVKALTTRSGSSLSDVNNALSIVMDIVGLGAARITEADVNQACADVAEEIVWNLTDAIAASDGGKALKALRNLEEMGRHPDEIIGTINWLLKTAYQLATPETAGGVNRFVATKVGPLAQKLGQRKLEDAFALCTDTQFMMRETGVDAGLAMDLLVVKLSGGKRRPSASARE